tara:strand:- start:150 stop:770 length:621 start_codon:yes stop_codon:yes gene_type:complete
LSSINSIFAIPVFGIELSGISDSLGLEDIVRELCSEDREPWQIRQTNGSIHKDKRLEPLCERIISSVNDISSNIIKYDPSYEVEITSMWGNIQRPGASLHRHSHHNSIFAGSIYINEIDSVDGEFPSIQFARPWKTQFNPSITEDNVYNFSEAWVTIKKDLTVIFPAWLEHQVKRNLTDKDRLSIAFNIMLRGRFGDENTLESTLF